MKRIAILCVAICIIALGLMVAQPYSISGDCMEPAIQDGKRYFLNRLSPYLRKYRIGDIILYRHEGKIWISRIVALEDDIIEIKDCTVVVNNVPLQEESIIRDWNDWQYGTYAIDKPFHVPRGHVYVLSDKLSAHHDDSRVFGPIAHAAILGVIW